MKGYISVKKAPPILDKNAVTVRQPGERKQDSGDSCDKLTDGVAFPAAAALSEAGAVHHVSFLVLFVEGLVHLVGQAIHDALI